MKCLVCGGKYKLLYNSMFDDRYGAYGMYSVFSCMRCGFGRTNPVLSRKEIGRFYKKYYPLSFLSTKKVKASAKVLPRFLTWLTGVDNTAHRQVGKNKEVLDVGSGSGISLLEIKKLGSMGFGVEPDPNAQKIAKKLHLNVFKGFITDDPYPGKKFDIITGSQVFEHEPDPFKFLKSARSKLKTDGSVILSVPNFDSVYRKIFGKKWLNWHIPYHINFFSKTSFEKLIKKSGLKIIRMKTITPNIWTLMQIRSLLTNVKMGRKNPIWTVSASRGNLGEESFGWKNFVLAGVSFLFYIMVTPINRIIDIFGMGDSLLVTLKNEK